MLEFLKSNYSYILIAVELIFGIVCIVVNSTRSKRLKLLQVAQECIAEAEKLTNATPEQKKAYASALIKERVNSPLKTISFCIESLIDFSKQVNSKTPIKTIKEVLANENEKQN